jgi:hypothetical protein
MNREGNPCWRRGGGGDRPIRGPFDGTLGTKDMAMSLCKSRREAVYQRCREILESRNGLKGLEGMKVTRV